MPQKLSIFEDDEKDQIYEQNLTANRSRNTKNKQNYQKYVDRVDKYDIIIWILLLLIACSFIPGLFSRNSVVKSNESIKNNQKQNLNTIQAPPQQTYPPEQQPKQSQQSHQAQIERLVEMKVQQILAQKMKSISFQTPKPNTLTRQNSIPKQELPIFQGKCISKDGCSFRKQINSSNFQILKSIGVHFYALQKLDRPLDPPKPPEYYNISLVEQYQQLPICMILVGQNSKNSLRFNSFRKSIQQQEYSNYILEIDDGMLSNNQLNSYKFKHFLDLKCPEKSIVMLVEGAVKSGSLQKINEIYQTRYTWLTFYQQQLNYNEKKKPTHGITSFYNKFYQNLPIKSFKLNDSASYDDLYVAMIQMGYSHAYRHSYDQIYDQPTTHFQHIANIHQTFNKKNYANIFHRSIPYLTSNYYFQKMEPLLINYIRMKKGQGGSGYIPQNGTFLTTADIDRNLQNIGLKDLPDSHLLYQRESNYLQRKYKLSEIKEQKGMCVVVLSFNNIEGDRYKYAIDTVFTQNYTNFHIVFIDDASTDNTLEATKTRVIEKGYDRNKIDYVRNSQKKYATYNIKNAGDNYCQSGEVLVLIDGDDQVVGVNALKILNLGYVKHNKWLVYSSYFSTSLTFGGSKQPYPSFFTDIVRQRYYLIGPIRSFYVNLFRLIKQQDHKDDQGNFLPNYYDGALQYPLFEMCGPDKIMYIPEISYLYTINYHGSDSKSKSHPRPVYQQMIYSRPRYQRLSEQEFQKINYK